MPMIQQRLADAVSAAASSAAPSLGLDPDGLPTPDIERPRQREHGDWATNLALILAGKAGRPPREVAEAVARELLRNPLLTKVEVAGPGFINMFLGTGWLHETLAEILEQGASYGRAEPNGERVQVEYVSANPTGPLHVGTARNAALGDSLANVLEAAGNEVEREYYFNDAGRQMELFGRSVEVRYLELFGRQEEFPEEGYRGEYVKDLAEALAKRHGDALTSLDPAERAPLILREAMDLVMDGIRATLERFGVHIDTWFSEGSLHRSGAIAETVARLRASGHAYDAEGAVFFRSTEFGDEKDRVLIRSNGEPTYFAADCAYVLNKARRGFDHLVYVWGADHHGTVKRLLGAAEALGVDANMVEIVLYQLVSLYRGGEPVKMSKREGDYVTLDELLDEVGPDAARYTLLTRSNDSTLDFDIEEVKRQTLENPVYYVQYAHARIASLVRVAGDQGVALHEWPSVNFALLEHESELDLLRRLSEFPEVVQTAAAARAPHRLTRYAEIVAAEFHHFYSKCRVITDDAELTKARLWLSVGAKTVIGTTLALIGVSAPESMERLAQDEQDEQEEEDGDGAAI